MPAFQVGILAEWRPIPWDQRHGVRLSFYVFFQICLVLVMATMRLEQIDAKAGNGRQIEAFVGNANNKQSLIINENQNDNKTLAADVLKENVAAAAAMKKKHTMPARAKKKEMKKTAETNTANELKKGIDVKQQFFGGNVDAKTIDIDAKRRLKRDIGVQAGDSGRKIESCTEGCALIKNHIHYSKPKEQHLGMCYPSLYDVKGFGHMMTTGRFRLKQAKSNDNLYDICKDCDTDRANWHGIKLNWEKDLVTIESSLWEGSKIVTEIVKKQFEGNVSKFLDALFEERGDNSKDIFWAGGELTFLNNPATIEDGAFFRDFNENEIDAIILLHLDISASLNYVNIHRNESNAFRIWVNYLPTHYLNYTLEQQKLLEKCEEEVDGYNRAAGEYRYKVYERFCLMNEKEEQNLYGVLIPPRPADGPNETWGGSTATGPLPYLEPESIEDERKKANSFEVVEMPKKYPNNPSNRIKRQEDPLAKCNVTIFDVRKKFPMCSKYINNIRNQGDCNSCWAVATASTLTDRSCIFISKMRPTMNIDYDPGRVVSARDTMECSHESVRSCGRGSYTIDAWKYYVEKSTVNEYCKPYVFDGARADWNITCHTKCDKSSNQHGSLDIMPWKNGYDHFDFGVNEEDTKTWDWNKKHSGIFFKPTQYHEISRGDKRQNEEQMKRQLEEDGPIVAAFTVYKDFKYGRGEKLIYKYDGTSKYKGKHAVRVIGYGFYECGNDPPEKFWLAANSWDSNWGENGLFRIARGIDECEFETMSVTWGTLTTFPYSQESDGKN